MKGDVFTAVVVFSSILLLGCNNSNNSRSNASQEKVAIKGDLLTSNSSDIQFDHEIVNGINICRHEVPSKAWEKLSLRKKKLIYYLSQAGHSGRDIHADQKHKYNLEVLELISTVHKGFKGDTLSKQWKLFDRYAFKALLLNGIFNPFSKKASRPQFSKKWFNMQLEELNLKMREEIELFLFPNDSILEEEGSNFYASNVSLDEARSFYARYILSEGEHDSLEIGLNTKLVKNNKNQIIEKKYALKEEGGASIDKIIFWLKKAAEVAESEKQKVSINTLIKYYQTGDLKLWEQFNLEWLDVRDNEVDFINGFVEKYEDPLARKGSYESLVYIVDQEYSKKLKKLADKAQWFEENAPISDNHKRTNISAPYVQVVDVVSASGSISPDIYTEIGLPNAEWIRNDVGTKNMICKNILDVRMSFAAQGVLTEFANDEEEVLRHLAHGSEASVLRPSLRMLGYTFGKIEEGVGSPSATLGENASIINYIIASTFTCYYALDSRLVEFGFVSSSDVGKALVDDFLRTSYIESLGNFPIGKMSTSTQHKAFKIMTHWLVEKGSETCIEVKTRENKTYINVTDYNLFQELLGQLLNEAVSIEATGDLEGAKKLCEYALKPQIDLATEVHERKSNLELLAPPFFFEPLLKPIYDDNKEIIDVEIIYDKGVTERLLQLSDEFGFMRKLRKPKSVSN